MASLHSPSSVKKTSYLDVSLCPIAIFCEALSAGDEFLSAAICYEDCVFFIPDNPCRGLSLSSIEPGTFEYKARAVALSKRVDQLLRARD